MSKLDELGLSDDFEKKDTGLGQYISKPTQRKFQPFGGPPRPMQPERQSSLVESYPTEPQAQAYSSPLDNLDTYDQFKSNYKAISGEASNYNTISSRWNGLYDDYLEKELKPFYSSLDLYDDDILDKSSGDEYIERLDKIYDGYTKTSQAEEGGFFSDGPSEAEIGRAKEGVSKFRAWGGANGLREKFFKLKQERDNRKLMSDQMSNAKVSMLEQMTSIPLAQRVALDDALKNRGKGEKDPRKVSEMLDKVQWEDPLVDFGRTGRVINQNRVDPRRSLLGAEAGIQSRRLQSAYSGDVEQIISERYSVDRSRQLRSKGYMVPHQGTLPKGLSAQDVDILDAAKLKEAGITDFKGIPVDEAISSLGGEEQLEAAKILKGVFQARQLYRQASIDFIKVAGGGSLREEAQLKMQKAQEAYYNALGVAGEFGLNSRVYGQMTSTDDDVSWWQGMKNAIARGFKMSDQAQLSDELALNRANESTMRELIDLSNDIEDLPGSTSFERLKNSKSESVWDAIGNILLDNPGAIPELIAETTAAFFPTYIDTGVYAVPGIAATASGTTKKLKGRYGVLSAIGLGARLNGGIASFALEYAGKVKEEMDELGIDTDDPEIMMAAWQSPVIRNKLRKTAALKAGGVALFDTFSGLMAGRVQQASNYLQMKGGKLTNASKFAKAKGRSDWTQAGLDVPIFTRWQRGKGALAETGLGVASGSGGELFSQLISRDPGESIDYDAVVLEGVVDIASPFSVYGDVRSMMRRPDRFDFAQATPTWTEPQPLEVNGQVVGTQGTETRAGMTRPYFTSNSSDYAAARIMDDSNIEFDSEQGKWLQQTMMQFQQMDPQVFKDIRFIVSERTPESPQHEGFFEVDPDSGAYVLSFNKKLMQENPLRAFMHESSHVARRSIFPNNLEFLTMYNSLGKDLQLDALAEYMFKRTDAKFSQLKPAEQMSVENAYSNMSELKRAEEWFALQYGRVLAGLKVHTSVAKPLDNFLESFIRPAMKGWVGSEKTAGPMKIQLDSQVLQHLGWGPSGIKMGMNLPHSYDREGVRAPEGALPQGFEGMSEQEGINFLWEEIQKLSPEDQQGVKETLEALVGRKFKWPGVSAFVAQETITKKEAKAKGFKQPKKAAKIYSKEKVTLAEEYQNLEAEIRARVEAEANEKEKKGDFDRDDVENLEAEYGAMAGGSEATRDQTIDPQTRAQKVRGESSGPKIYDGPAREGPSKSLPSTKKKVPISPSTKTYTNPKNRKANWITKQVESELSDAKVQKTINRIAALEAQAMPSKENKEQNDAVLKALQKIESLITDPKALEKAVKEARNKRVKEILGQTADDEDGKELTEKEKIKRNEAFDKAVSQISLVEVISDIAEFPTLLKASRRGTSTFLDDLITFDMKTPSVPDIKDKIKKRTKERDDIFAAIRDMKAEVSNDLDDLERGEKESKKQRPISRPNQSGGDTYIYKVDLKRGTIKTKDRKKHRGTIKELNSGDVSRLRGKAKSYYSKLKELKWVKDSKQGYKIGRVKGRLEVFKFQKRSAEKAQSKGSNVKKEYKTAIRSAIVKAVNAHIDTFKELQGIKVKNNRRIQYSKKLKDPKFREIQAKVFGERGFSTNFMDALFDLAANGEDTNPMTIAEAMKQVNSAIKNTEKSKRKFTGVEVPDELTRQSDTTPVQNIENFNTRLRKLVDGTMSGDGGKTNAQLTLNNQYAEWAPTLENFAKNRDAVTRRDLENKVLQVMTEEPGKGLQSETFQKSKENIRKRIQLLEEAEAILAPEDSAIQWADLPVPKGGLFKGGKPYIKLGNDLVPLTLRGLATKSTKTDIFKENGELLTKLTNPQETLLKFYLEFDINEGKSAKEAKPDTEQKRLDGRTPRQYKLALAAAVASKHSPARGESVDTKRDDRSEVFSFAPGQLGSTEGTNLLQILASRIFDINKRPLDREYTVEGQEKPVLRKRMSEQHIYSVEDSMLYDIANLKNMLGDPERVEVHRTMWIMYQKALQFAEAIKMAEENGPEEGESPAKYDQRIAQHARNINSLLGQEFASSAQVGQVSVSFLDPTFKLPKNKKERDRELARLRILYNKAQEVSRERDPNFKPTTFNEWVKKKRLLAKQHDRILRERFDKKVANAIDKSERGKKRKTKLAPAGEGQVRLFDEEHPDGITYESWINEKRDVKDFYKQKGESIRPNAKLTMMVDGELRIVEGKQFVNRMDIRDTGMRSEGSQTEMPLEVTPEGVDGGRLFSGALSEYDYEFMKAEAIDKILDIWEKQINTGGLEAFAQAGTAWRDFFKTSQGKDADKDFQRTALDLAYSLYRAETSKDKLKSRKDWGAKQTTKGGGFKLGGKTHKPIPTTSDKLRELAIEAAKIRAEVVKIGAKKSPESRELEARLKENFKEAETEREEIAGEALKIREGIFESYSELYNKAPKQLRVQVPEGEQKRFKKEAAKEELQKTNDIILGNLKRSYTKRGFAKVDTLENVGTEENPKWQGSVGVSYESFRQRVRPFVSRKETDRALGKILPNYRGRDEREYEYVGDADAFENPDFVVEKYGAVHGDFKRGVLDTPYQVASMYLAQARKVFSKLFKLDGKPGVKRDTLGVEFPVPDAVRKNGKFASWNRAFQKREMLNIEFARDFAKKGDPVEFKGTDSNGETVQVSAEFDGEVWRSVRGGAELSREPGKKKEFYFEGAEMYDDNLLAESSIAIIEAKDDPKYIFLSKDRPYFGKSIRKDDKDGKRVKGQTYTKTDRAGNTLFELDIVGDFYEHVGLKSGDGKPADLIFVDSMEEAEAQMDAYVRSGSKKKTGLVKNPDPVPLDRDRTRKKKSIEVIFASSLQAQAVEAFAEKQAALGELYKMQSSENHISPLTLLRLYQKGGVNALEYAPTSDARKPGQGAAREKPGTPFAPYLLNRIMHPLLEKMFKDLKINMDAEVKVVGKQEEVSIKDLLASIDRIAPGKVDADTKSSDKDKAARMPSEILMTGSTKEGEPGHLGVVENWIEENELKIKLGGMRFEDLKVEEVKKKSGAVKKERERLDIATLQNERDADVIVLFAYKKDSKKKKEERKKQIIEDTQYEKDEDKPDVIVIDLFDPKKPKSKAKKWKPESGANKLKRVLSNYKKEEIAPVIYFDASGYSEEAGARIKDILDSTFKDRELTEEDAPDVSEDERAEQLEKRKGDKYFDSSVWDDLSFGRDKEDLKGYSFSLDALLKPLLTAALNARRLDILDQASEAEKQAEVVQRDIQEGDTPDSPVSTSMQKASPPDVDADIDDTSDDGEDFNPPSKFTVGGSTEDLNADEVSESQVLSGESLTQKQTTYQINLINKDVADEILNTFKSKIFKRVKKASETHENKDFYLAHALTKLLNQKPKEGLKNTLHKLFEGAEAPMPPTPQKGKEVAFANVNSWWDEFESARDGKVVALREYLVDQFADKTETLAAYKRKISEKVDSLATDIKRFENDITESGNMGQKEAVSPQYETPRWMQLSSGPSAGYANSEKVGYWSNLWSTLKSPKAWDELTTESKRALKDGYERPGGTVDKIMVDYVDKFRPIKRMFYGFQDLMNEGDEQLMEKGNQLYDQLNTWGKIHRYLGIGYSEIEQARIRYQSPIAKAVRDSGTTVATVGEYLLARMAPARNAHIKLQIKDMIEDLQSDKNMDRRTAKIKELNEKLENDAPSGISDKDAEAIVLGLEQDPEFIKFIQHENNPLQRFYEMMQEDLANRESAQLINEEEVSRMTTAASYFDWSNLADGKSSVFMFTDKKGKKSKYSYAPMQGFEDELQAMTDNEKAWEILGQKTKSAGKGFDQPKQKFLFKGAFGRFGSQVDGEGNKGVKGPDPEIVLGVAEQQHLEGSIRANKNTASISFGDLHDTMRRIAFGEEKDYPTTISKVGDLDLDELHKNENLRDKVKAEYNKFFKDHIKEVPKTEYVWEDQEIDEEGRLKVVSKKLSTTFKDDPHVFVFRKQGVPHYIQFQENAEGKMLAASLKNMRYEAMPDLMALMNDGTRMMSQAFTAKNPGFTIPNFIKDFGSALIHLSEDDKIKLIPQMTKNIPKFMKAIYQAETMIRGKDKNPVDVTGFKHGGSKVAEQILAENDPVKMYMFAKANGALVGYFNAKSVPQLVKDMTKKTDPNSETQTKKAWKSFTAFLDSANSVAENSVRIATFWASIQDGRSVQESAIIARRVTVDFNMGGNNSTAMNSMYMFFRAAVSGSERTFMSFKNRGFKKSSVLIGSMIGASYSFAMMARFMDDDEEEIEPVYDTQSSYTRYRQMVFPLPSWLMEIAGMKDENAVFTVPLPLGAPASIWGVGQYMADLTSYYAVGRGGQGAFGATGDLMKSIQDTGNPFGSGDVLSLLTPSLATPVMELAMNKDFMGRPIRYEQRPFGQPKPPHKLDPKRTGSFFTDFSAWMNKRGGGDDNVIGSLRGVMGQNPLYYNPEEDWKWDWSGSQIRHMLYGYLGGPFGESEKLVKMFASLKPGEDFKMRNVPVMSRFFRESSGSSYMRMANLRDAVKSAETVVKNAPPKGKQIARNFNAKLLAFSNDVATYDRARLRIKDQKDAITNSSRSYVDKAQLIANLEAKELGLRSKIIIRAQKAGIAV